MESENRPKVGIGVMIFKDGKILLAQRKGSHGAGEWAFPGGHLEYMESFYDCIQREINEECGIGVKDFRFNFVANVKHYAPKQYVHVGLIADWANGDPKLLEPDKFMSEWGWYDIDNLPKPLFRQCELAIEAYKTGKNYFDA